jgi:stage II sporulation protein D
MRWLSIFLIGFICFAQLAAAQGDAEQSTVTVRLFSTQIIQEITFIPLGANVTLRVCRKCLERRVDSPVRCKQIKDELQLAGDPHPHKKVELRGAFRVHVEGLREPQSASGQWLVNPTNTGLRILLTISTEHYVMGALNGEAAPDEPLESLKAMSVVARTFTLVNLHRHAAEGFDFCDSTHCQTLRFGSVRLDIEQAVQATTGETLWYEGYRAETYATQHCGGEAEDVASVWPALHAPYLRRHQLYTEDIENWLI